VSVCPTRVSCGGRDSGVFADRVGRVILAADLHERTTHGGLPSACTGLAGALAVRRGGRPGRGPWRTRCVVLRPPARPLWFDRCGQALPIGPAHRCAAIGVALVGLGGGPAGLAHPPQSPPPGRLAASSGAGGRPLDRSSRSGPRSRAQTMSGSAEAFSGGRCSSPTEELSAYAHVGGTSTAPWCGLVVAPAGVLLPVAGRVGTLPDPPPSASEGAIALPGVFPSPRTSDLAPDAMRSRHLRCWALSSFPRRSGSRSCGLTDKSIHVTQRAVNRSADAAGPPRPRGLAMRDLCQPFRVGRPRSRDPEGGRHLGGGAPCGAPRPALAAAPLCRQCGALLRRPRADGALAQHGPHSSASANAVRSRRAARRCGTFGLRPNVGYR
jgi:hypothetical protein